MIVGKNTNVIKMVDEKKEEGKTLFEHLGLTGGQKDGAINKSFEKMKKMAISFGVYVLIGYILGMILDVMLSSGIYSIVLALTMSLIWIVAAFGKYLKIK